MAEAQPTAASTTGWGEGTRAVHAGLPGPEPGQPFLPGPAFAAPYHLSGDVDSSPFAYGRDDNPTWANYERALGELEGGAPGRRLRVRDGGHDGGDDGAPVSRRRARGPLGRLLLVSRPDVTQVRYPGLQADPAHAVAAAQMRRFGAIIAFSLSDKARAVGFLASARLVFEATSFGGTHTTAERRARWGTDAVGEGFIRLSVGCEDMADLVGDIEQALDRA